MNRFMAYHVTIEKLRSNFTCNRSGKPLEWFYFHDCFFFQKIVPFTLTTRSDPDWGWGCVIPHLDLGIQKATDCSRRCFLTCPRVGLVMYPPTCSREGCLMKSQLFKCGTLQLLAGRLWGVSHHLSRIVLSQVNVWLEWLHVVFISQGRSLGIMQYQS